MRREYLVMVGLLGLLVVGRVGTRVWGVDGATGVPAAHRTVSSFIMTIEGDSSMATVGSKVVVGEAAYQRRSSKGGGQFSLELGSTSEQASVVFSADGLGPTGPGIYQVDDRPGSTSLHALVVTGSPTRPTGVYRAQSGKLTLQDTGGGQLDGSFELWARGFTALDPTNDNLMIGVSGSFLAIEH